MQDDMISRRTFLAGSAAVFGLAAVPLLTGAAPAAASPGNVFTSPWPYAQLDPDAVGLRAYEIYFEGHCGEGCWYSVIEALAASSDPAVSAPWSTIPWGLFKFAAGGVSGWGTVCGALNGAAAVMAATGAPAGMIDALMQWYTEATLPTNFVDNQVRGGWTATAPAKAPLVNVPTSIAGSPLCHASLSQWSMVSKGLPASHASVPDRCAKLTADVARKSVELLNAYHKDGVHVIPTTVLAPSVVACKASGCHSGAFAQGKQDCEPCHTVDGDHADE